MTPSASRKIGILVGGGPAPGINAVISAATIEAINNGFEVIGFYDGLKWLTSEGFDPAVHTHVLSIRQVARIHFEGGSIVRTARTSLLDDTQLGNGRVHPDRAKVQRVLSHLLELGVECLITIGGDDTALSARFLTEEAGHSVRIVHVPKTIDNDLPLPHDTTTFGFSTARYEGAHIVKNLMRDSQTSSRWYLALAMGRSAGWLALGIGYSAGATLTLIPEEFPDKISLQHLADILEGSILKRRTMGRPDGVAVLAEGLAYRLGDVAELERILGSSVQLDAAGHPRLSEFPLADILKQELQRRFAARGEKITIVTNQLGYQLRCADPTPGDMAYCRSLGHGCIHMLLNADDSVPAGSMVTLVNGNLKPIPLVELIDPKTNRMRTRVINVNSDHYRAARAYMIRLEQRDFDDPQFLAQLAREAGMTPDEFTARYAATARPAHDETRPPLSLAPRP